MKVISVNVGLPQEIEWNGKIISTGIYKEPVDGPISLKKLNLEGDGQADLTVHGGPNMAVYVYSANHYEFWKKQLPSHELNWGAFGENLTVEGCSDDEVCIGDRFRMGTAEVQVTQPRVPCFKLGIRFGDQGMVKQFMNSGRFGFYLRVLKEGAIQADDGIEKISQDSAQVAVSDIMMAYQNPDMKDLMQKIITVKALPKSWREHFEKLLATEKA